MIFIKKRSQAELPAAHGTVSDTWNVIDEHTNAPSIRLTKGKVLYSNSTGTTENINFLENISAGDKLKIYGYIIDESSENNISFSKEIIVSILPTYFNIFEVYNVENEIIYAQFNKYAVAASGLTIESENSNGIYITKILKYVSEG